MGEKQICEKESWESTRAGIKEVDGCVMLKAQYYEHGACSYSGS